MDVQITLAGMWNAYKVMRATARTRLPMRPGIGSVFHSRRAVLRSSRMTKTSKAVVGLQRSGLQLAFTRMFHAWKCYVQFYRATVHFDKQAKHAGDKSCLTNLQKWMMQPIITDQGSSTISSGPLHLTAAVRRSKYALRLEKFSLKNWNCRRFVHTVRLSLALVTLLRRLPTASPPTSRKRSLRRQSSNHRKAELFRMSTAVWQVCSIDLARCMSRAANLRWGLIVIWFCKQEATGPSTSWPTGPRGKSMARVLKSRLLHEIGDSLKHSRQYAYIPGRATYQAIATVAKHCSDVRATHKTVLDTVHTRRKERGEFSSHGSRSSL